MKIITMYTDCLTYEQLQNYTLAKSNKAEHAHIYMHISGCELCACAVNGFAAIPFTSADVDAIHNQIDVRTNATHANLLTFAQVSIIIISILSIFGFYKFANSTANKKTEINFIENSKPYIVSSLKLNPLPVSENKMVTMDKTERLVRMYARRPLERLITAVEPAESIPEKIIETPLNALDGALQSTYNSEVMYIYDLKVADYNNLYFTHSNKQLTFRENTPAFRENKVTPNNLIETDVEQSVAADKVLKKGLQYFNEGKYANAICQFRVLIENNPDDVNALFYSGVAFLNIGIYNSSAKELESVLLNNNNVFHPEAKWNLAKAVLKSGNTIKAKQLLTEIANEKGFYAKRATDKLKTL